MAGSLILDWQPLDPLGIEDEAVAATWARLRVTAVRNGRERCLTSVEDKHAHSTRCEVYGSVLPLAEWIARCWHPLFSSRLSRPSNHASAQLRRAWDKTHRWRYCGEGTALPDLEFERLDAEWMRVRARRDEEVAEFERVVFLEEGTVDLRVETLERTLGDFVDSVLRRLAERASGNGRAADLATVWASSRSPEHPEFEIVRFAARLGWHWWALRKDRRAEIEAQRKRIENPIADAGLEAAASMGIEDWIRSSSQVWTRCTQAESAKDDWRTLREQLAHAVPSSNGDSRPWQRGWRAAGRLREVLGKPVVPWDGADRIATLGVLEVLVPGDGSFKSIIGWQEDHGPVVGRPREQPTTRFGRTRDLYPLLFQGTLTRDFGTVLSSRIAGTLPVANAFACELIAPAEYVREALGGRKRVDEEDLEEVAAQLNAPSYCIEHQVRNHELAEVVKGG
ncbi:MAG: hypothetical protein H6834_11325 [Planctomycetes bacterium]|nr:hypothetical protein [Planctomycetota bacterium]